MNINDVKSNLSMEFEVIRDFNFDYLVLLGKPKSNDGKYLSFLLNLDYLSKFLDEKIDAVICKPEMVETVKQRFNGGICTSTDPKTTFFQIHEAMYEANKKEFKSIIDSTAQIDKTAIISDKNVIIGPNVKIAAGCLIKPNVEISAGVHLEENCVIGSPAFYYYGNNENRRLVKSTGGVFIGRNVGIHTNVTIEKGVFTGKTTIEDNCAIDNFVLIEHDCYIGENTIIAGKVTLAGGTEVGENCYLGVGSTVSNNIHIGDNSKLCVGSAVSRDVPANSEYAGNYAIEHEKFIKDLKNKIK